MEFLEDGSDQPDGLAGTVAEKRILIARRRRAERVGQLLDVAAVDEDFRAIKDRTPRVEGFR